MRIVRKAEDLPAEFNSARNEAKKAFGIDDIFIENILEKPKDIQVQVMGDKYGNIVHLYEARLLHPDGIKRSLSLLLPLHLPRNNVKRFVQMRSK